MRAVGPRAAPLLLLFTACRGSIDSAPLADVASATDAPSSPSDSSSDDSPSPHPDADADADADAAADADADADAAACSLPTDTGSSGCTAEPRAWFCYGDTYTITCTWYGSASSATPSPSLGCKGTSVAGTGHQAWCCPCPR